MTSAGKAFERNSFVAVTTTDLARARAFWVEGLGATVTEEAPGHHVMMDVGGLRLCIDVEDGDTHRAGGGDPVVGLKVLSLPDALEHLAGRGVRPIDGPTRGARGSYARFRDPDGRIVILTEAD